MTLLLPVKDILVTQYFGENWLDFYAKLGMKGHNGIDFTTRRGCVVLASHDGIVNHAGKDGDGGIGIEISSTMAGEGIKTLYYHLKTVSVYTGNEVKAGQVIGLADNTGKYTTGDHLHFGLKLIKSGVTLNKGNGYNGAIDPSSYFIRNWDKSAAYHRYGRKGNSLVDFWFRFTPLGVKNQWTESGRWVQRQLKNKRLPLLSTEQVNALIYGAWDFESVINPSMRPLWGWLTKDEYNRGEKAFD
jgi:murein DD-endopeptidase MepM/ murein hydrolase activator NlpD